MKKDAPYSGMIIIHKETGYTSSDVVAKLRGILHMRKIGHTGTLDPGATGVLPVCLGSATKLCELIADRDKEYVAVCRLGVTTDTEDMSGEVLTRCLRGSLPQLRSLPKRMAAGKPRSLQACKKADLL